jgi:hypothetical protein
MGLNERHATNGNTVLKTTWEITHCHSFLLERKGGVA